MNITLAHRIRFRGVAAISALIFSAIFAILAISFIASSQTLVELSRNERCIGRAQAAAESGLEYMKNLLSQFSSPVPATDATFQTLQQNLNNFCAGYGLKDDSGNAITTAWVSKTDSGGNAYYEIDFPASGYVTIAGSTFKIQFTRKTVASSYRLHAVVTGQDNSIANSTVTRTVGADFFGTVNYPMFDNGMYSLGSITLGGGGTVQNDGTYSDSNGNPSAVLWSASSAVPSISVSGNSAINNFLYYTDPNTGKVTTINGNLAYYANSVSQFSSTNGQGHAIDMSRVKQANPINAFTFDPSVFSYLAPTYYSSSNPGPYTNVRIAAGSNANITGATFNGILYIESPNNVSFSGGTFNCAIVFANKTNSGTISTPGVDNLSFSGSFTAGPIPSSLTPIRDALLGYGILAPTVNLKIAGNSSQTQTLFGSVVCYTMNWTGGNSLKVLDGAMVTLSTGTSACNLGGNGSITFSKDSLFVKPVNGIYGKDYVATGFWMIPSTYTEGTN